MLRKLKSSEACHRLVKTYEGLGPAYAKTGKIIAYICPSGKPTIGWGHTGPDVKASDVGKKAISLEQAEHYFLVDILIGENIVNSLVKVELSQPQFDALTSFAYNVGRGNFQTSTLLRELNKGNFTCVPAQLRRWVHGDKTDPKTGQKEVLPGLVARREAEVQLWRGH